MSSVELLKGMKLYHFAHSSASFRVRIALALKGVDVDYVSVDMLQREQQGEAYRKLNPQRMLPCLELADGRVISQSLAIIEFLDQLCPEPSLFPNDPVERAQALALAMFIFSETAPFQAKYIRRTLTEEFGLSDEQDMVWTSRWIRRGLGLMNEALCKRGTAGPFALGSTPGIVDIAIIPQLRNAERVGVPTSDFGELHRLQDVCHAHPAFQAAHPDRWV